MAPVRRRVARDPRLAVLPVIGLFLGLVAGLFISDAASVPDVAVAAPIRPPDPRLTSPTPDAPRRRPDARPTLIVVPSIDVRARMVGVGLNVDGSMEVPEFGLAGWYTRGPRPGQPGPAVVTAHVDSRAGPDVFYRLHELRPGALVRIRLADETWKRWVVRSSEQTPKDDLPVERIWNDTREPVLRLVTCGGRFNTAIRHYADNIIVYAEPA